MQITAYVVEDGRFKPIEVAADADIPDGAVWIDALENSSPSSVRDKGAWWKSFTGTA